MSAAPAVVSAPALAAAVAALQHTLREAAFLFVDPVADAPRFTGELLEARLGWSGTGGAELRLITTPGFAAALAANLVGADEPDPLRAGDALAEILNMAAGALVHDAFGPRADCHLGVPTTRSTNAAEWEGSIAGTSSRASLLEESGHRVDLLIVPAAAPAVRLHPAGTGR